MSNQIYITTKKVKIIIAMNIVFLSSLGIGNYIFTFPDVMDLNLLMHTIYRAGILIGVYMPFLMLIYINSMYKQDSFNRLILFRMKNREQWLSENLKFIFKSSLFLVGIFMVSIVGLVVLNINKYGSVILTYQYIFNISIKIFFLYMYLSVLGLLFLLFIILLKKVNRALLAMVGVIFIDSVIMEIDVLNTVTRLFLINNVKNTPDMWVFSFFYWILITSVILLALNILKDKVDLV
ncbi:MAG: hypothetical protein ACRC6T_12030 [Sarcina sp.]